MRTLLTNCFFLLGFIVFSCKNESHESVIRQDKQYFSVSDFFREEAKRLASMEAVKIAMVSGKMEEKRVKGGFEREIQMFSESDINRPALFGKYAIDSISVRETLVVRYKALDDRLRTRLLQVRTKGQKVEEIQILNESFSLVGFIRQFLIWKPDVGFSIENRQKFRWTDESVMKIEGLFLSPDI